MMLDPSLLLKKLWWFGAKKALLASKCILFMTKGGFPSLDQVWMHEVQY